MENTKRKIVVVGTGYVGLSMATLLAQHNRVTAVDIVPQKVEMVNRRQSPISDKGIEEAFANQKLDLVATTDGVSAYADAEFVIIATPTNYDTELNFFDTSAVECVIDEVLAVNPTTNIVIKSTVPVGFTQMIRGRKQCSNIYFSPEFLREGWALHDNLYPSRIIVGANAENEAELQTANDFIALLKQGAKKTDIEALVMGLTESEAVKLFANTYLALRVSYFNELDTYAELKGLKTGDIIRGVCLDPRIGEHYNNPSFGYGGYCLPKDTKQLLANYENVPENLIEAIVQANSTRKDFIANQILARAKANNPQNAVVGAFRLAMKMDSDNFRQSSIIGVMNRLRNKGVTVVVYEPSLKVDYFAGFKVIRDLDEFKRISDVVVTNRLSKDIEDIRHMVYTRDLYNRD